MKNKNNKNNLLITIIVGLLVLIALIVIGNVISIGDKIAGIHPILSYLFYGVVGIIFIWLVVFPVVRVIITPQLKGISKENISDYTPSEVTEYINDLKKGIKFTREEERELDLGDDRKKTIEKILNNRYEEMEKAVKKAAVSNFVITAISQNGSLDFIASITINFRMINHIVNQLGKRPSYSQLIKLYISVVSASLVITAIDDIIDDIDFNELLGGLLGIGASRQAAGVVGLGVVVDTFISSAINGLMNAYVTLRVGYATIKYLEVGNENFDRKETRKYAIKLARKQLLNVGKEGFAEAIKKAGKMLKIIVE